MDLTPNLTEVVNCTQAAIDDFPNDLFTQEQRQNGAVVLHVIASLYLFAALAVVCDKYFVPAVDKMCKVLNMSNDVAGATFMAAATSAPELFVNVIGTFITEGDIGVGTIVGSAVFNILAVAACCGIGAGMVVPLDWWPLTRDCVAYGITVAILICIIHDERVEWYEALILVCLYLVYIAVMYFDKKIQKWAKALLELTNVVGRRPGETGSIHERDIEAIEVCRPLQGDNRPGEHQQFNGGVKWPAILQKKISPKPDDFSPEIITQDKKEETEELNDKEAEGKLSEGKDEVKESKQKSDNDPDGNEKDAAEDNEIEDKHVLKSVKIIEDIKVEQHTEDGDIDTDEYQQSLLEWPSGRGWFIQTRWVITWPIYLIFVFSIPDCEKPRFRSWYPLTFLMCIIWIGSLSYVVAWMITILGHTLKIPDSVMGITFLAAGTSVPEAVSSVIVAKKGHGSMGISNSIGSNTFDILLCLGLPWLIKAAFIPTEPEHHWVAINSSGLEYSAISLLSTLFMLYIAFYFNKFRLDKKVGQACLCMYVVFLVLATLIELNVFFRVNLPTCGR